MPLLKSQISTHLPIEHKALHLIHNIKIKNVIVLFDIFMQVLILNYILSVERASCVCESDSIGAEIRTLQRVLKYCSALSISYLILDSVLEFNRHVKIAAAVLSTCYVVLLAYYAWRQSVCVCDERLYLSIQIYAYASLFFLASIFGIFKNVPLLNRI
jgi:hypothetical protein